MAEPAFSGRVALVTGASGGLGAEISTRLAASGAAVGVHYRTDLPSAERVAAAIDAVGGVHVTVSADLRDPEAPRRVVDPWPCCATVT